MRRMILVGLIAVAVAGDASAQRRGGFAARVRGYGPGMHRARSFAARGFGYGYLPYGYEADGPYAYAPEPMVQVQPASFAPPALEPPPPEVHPAVTNYTWNAAAAAAPEGSAAQSFGIVLRNGTTVSAVMVVASGDQLQYVDDEERHLRVQMSKVDRAATLKLNRERKLTLHLPASE